MKVHHGSFQIKTNGKKTYEITEKVVSVIAKSGIKDGTVTIFIRHTSASVILMENADPTARKDLEAYFEHLVPEDTPYFVHTYEGPDDMPSHIRTILAGASEVIPLRDGRMTLGTWQGAFLFEHRREPHNREILVTVMGG